MTSFTPVPFGSKFTAFTFGPRVTPFTPRTRFAVDTCVAFGSGTARSSQNGTVSGATERVLISNLIQINISFAFLTRGCSLPDRVCGFSILKKSLDFWKFFKFFRFFGFFLDFFGFFGFFRIFSDFFRIFLGVRGFYYV